MSSQPVISGGILHLKGYIYYKTKSYKNHLYWECERYKSKECDIRIITRQDGNEIVDIKGLESTHEHPRIVKKVRLRD